MMDLVCCVTLPKFSGCRGPNGGGQALGASLNSGLMETLEGAQWPCV